MADLNVAIASAYDELTLRQVRLRDQGPAMEPLGRGQPR